MLRLEGIKKRLAGRVIIDCANLAVASGEIVCITGESGIGKSTLLEICAGVIRPDNGTVMRDGPASLCFQDNALIPWLDARGNIAYVLPPAMPEKEQHSAIAQWLGRFGLEEAVFPTAMSGGMRRRLALARAFAVQRPILLLDEPFAFLDEAWQRITAGCILEAARSATAVLLTSHTLGPLAGMPLRHVHAESSPLRLP